MKRMIISTLAGALAGYLYYYFVGCNSGACAITSNPYVSTVYFGIVGLLIGFTLKKEVKKTVKKEVKEA